MTAAFVSFEGLDGSGKTTQIELLRRALVDRGVEPVMVREPGGTEVGEGIRELVLNGPTMTADAEMYLYLAARAELLATRIKPALAAGRLVIADRYHDSTLAYQGGGRGAAATWPGSFPRPDLTIYLRVPADSAIARMRSAGKALDRLDAEPAEFHRRVAAAYERLIAAEPQRWFVVDASRPPDAIHADIAGRVFGLLEARTGARA